MLRPRASGPASGLYYRGAYAALDFASRIYELDDVSYTAGGLTSLPDFTFTGASLRTMFDSTGAMTYGPNNLFLQSQTFGTTWVVDRASITSDVTAAPDGSSTADKLTEDATAANSHWVSQQATSQVGQAFLFSVYIKAAERTFAAVYISGPNKGIYVNLTAGAYAGDLIAAPTAYTITNAGNGWWRVSVLATAVAGWVSPQIYLADATPNYVYNGNGTSGIYLWGAQLEAVTYQTTPSTYYPTTTAAYYGPRLVYDPVTLASLGILVEEARTNLCLQSQTFDNASWTKQRSSVTANTVTSPDGTTNADKLVEDATAANSHGISQVITTTAAAVYTISVVLKAAERTFAAVYASGPNVGIYVNLTTGAFAGNFIGAPTSYTITNAGNGWWRVAVVFTAVGASTTLAVYSANATPDYVYDGDGTSGIYLWQAQLEAGIGGDDGSVGASSPIPTTTAAVTRAADSVVLSGLSLAAVHSAVVSGVTGNSVSSTRVLLGLSAGGANDGSALYLSSGSPVVLNKTAGSNDALVIPSGSVTANSAAKIAARLETNNVNGSLNGGANGTTDTSCSIVAVTQIEIGYALINVNYFNGTISRIRIYNRALSDAQLQALTA